MVLRINVKQTFKKTPYDVPLIVEFIVTPAWEKL